MRYNFSKVESCQSSINLSSNNQKQKYVDYRFVYEQNKRRIQQMKSVQPSSEQNKSKKQTLFEEQYILKQLLEPKYPYIDLITISSYVIEQLMNNIQRAQGKTSNESRLIRIPQIHLLLYTHHLYTKDFRTFENQLFTILSSFLDQNPQINQFTIKEQLEFCVYLKKFIDFYQVFSNQHQLRNVTQKYCLFLKSNYEAQKKELLKKSQQIKFDKSNTEQTKLLEKYLLAYPCLWGSVSGIIKNQNHDSQEPIGLSMTIIQNYLYFTTQFKFLISQAIQYWLKNENLTVNATLRQEFKQKNLNECFNLLRLVYHRLRVILQMPKLFTDQKQNNKKDQKGRQNNNQYLALIEKYKIGPVNILNYLPNEKLTSDQEKTFKKLLILAHNLLGYQTLMEINHKQLTLFLKNLFQNNFQLILNSKNTVDGMEIKFLMGQLVSRLCSGSWTDDDNLFDQFFGNTKTDPKNQNKDKNSAKNQWFQ